MENNRIIAFSKLPDRDICPFLFDLDVGLTNTPTAGKLGAFPIPVEAFLHFRGIALDPLLNR